MVDVVKMKPTKVMKTDMITKQKTVRIPYSVPIKENKVKTVTYMQPVNKTKVVMEDRVRTVIDTKVKTKCVPVTKMVTKEIPMFTVVPKKPCGPTGDSEGVLEDGETGPFGAHGSATYGPGTTTAQGGHNEAHSEGYKKGN